LPCYKQLTRYYAYEKEKGSSKEKSKKSSKETTKIVVVKKSRQENGIF